MKMKEEKKLPAVIEGRLKVEERPTSSKEQNRRMETYGRLVRMAVELKNGYDAWAKSHIYHHNTKGPMRMGYIVSSG
jgi:hypothetical protein